MKTFEKLDLTKKYEMVRKHGTRVLTASYQQFCVTLYLLNGHYAESYFNVKTLKVERVQLTEYRDLEKYLDLITIHDIYWIL